MSKIHNGILTINDAEKYGSTELKLVFRTDNAKSNNMSLLSEILSNISGSNSKLDFKVYNGINLSSLLELNGSGIVTVNGNLNVTDTLSLLITDTTHLSVANNLFEINTNNTDNSNDSGFLIKRPGVNSNIFIGWDESDDKIVFGTTGATRTSTGNLTITPSDLMINDILVNGGNIQNSNVSDTVNIFNTTTGKVTIGGGDIDISASGYDTTINGTLNVNDVVTISKNSDTTNSVINTLTLNGTTDGVASNGLGVGINMVIENDNNVNTTGVSIEAVYTDVSNGSENVDLVLKTINDGTLTEGLRIKSDNSVQFSGAFTFPTTDGSASQILQTNGAGVVSWVDGGGGGSSKLNELTDVKYDTTTELSLFMGTIPSNLDNAQNSVSLGYQAVNDLTTGDNNTSIGFKSLFELTTGSNNTAIGKDAGKGNSSNPLTGSGNTCLGAASGSLIHTAASNNTFVGFSCGDTVTTGTNLICLGANTNPSSATASNEITLGDSNITALRCADASLVTLSDIRDKKDIVDSEYGLKFINSLRPVQYTWAKRVLVENDSNFINNGKKRLGFIAQDLQNAMGTKDNDILDLIYESNPERLEVKYGNLIPILTKAIQDLSNRVDKLEQYIQFNSI